MNVGEKGFPRPGALPGERGKAGPMSVVRRAALAFWRDVESECGGARDCAAALAAMIDEFGCVRAAARAEAARLQACHVRAVQFRRLLLATAALPAAVRGRAARRLAALHADVDPVTVAAALGWDGKMALARIRTAAEYELPPGRFEPGAPRSSEFEKPPGRAALIVAPGWPLPVDLVAVTLRDGRVYRLDDNAAVIGGGLKCLGPERLDVHVHPAAWLAARAAARRAGVNADTVPLLIADAGAVKWTRAGILGGVEMLNLVDAFADDPGDPVHTIWRLMPPALRRKVRIRTPGRGKKAAREKDVPSPRRSPAGEAEKVEAGG